MSPFRRLAAGMAVAAVAVIATAAPASAHDQLIFSDPAIDAQLEGAPDSVTMRFSGELVTLGDTSTGAVVLVVDETGRDWVSGDVEVLGDTVTVELAADMPDAGYQVRWQVVSEDGHPISGIIPFTIGDAEPVASTSSGATPGGGTDEPSETADQAPAGTGDALRVLLIGAGGAAVAVAALALYRIFRRPRTAAAPPESGDSADHTSERQNL